MTRRLLAIYSAASAVLLALAAQAEARFLQTDPVGYKDQLNLYAYVANDPVDGRDPSGTTAFNCTFNGDTNKGNCSVSNDGDNKHINAHLTYTQTVDGKLQTRYSNMQYGASQVLAAQSYGVKFGGVIASQANRAFGINVVFRSQPTFVYGSESFAGQGATAVGAPLRFLHTSEASAGNLSSFNYWKTRSNEEIIQSLAPGQRDSLKVKPDGTIMDGNTRLQILRDRGVDINSLPREGMP